MAGSYVTSEFRVRDARRAAARSRVRQLVWLIVGLTAADAVATAVWLGMGASEANPLVAAAIEAFGVGGGLLARFVWGAAAALLLGRVAVRSRLGEPLLRVALVLLSLLGVWHIVVGVRLALA